MKEADDYRFLKEKIIQEYQDKGLEKFQEFCVLSNIPLYVGTFFILEEIDDEKVAHAHARLLRFYGI